MVGPQRLHGEARCMAGDAAGTLLLVAGDGAGLSDAANDAVRVPVTVSVWRLPAANTAAALSSGSAVPTLLCSYGKQTGWSWPWASRLAASEPYCGWSASVSPDGRHIAIAQPGAELLVLILQVGALCRSSGCLTDSL